MVFYLVKELRLICMELRKKTLVLFNLTVVNLFGSIGFNDYLGSIIEYVMNSIEK